MQFKDLAVEEPVPDPAIQEMLGKRTVWKQPKEVIPQQPSLSCVSEIDGWLGRIWVSGLILFAEGLKDKQTRAAAERTHGYFRPPQLRETLQPVLMARDQAGKLIRADLKRPGLRDYLWKFLSPLVSIPSSGKGLLTDFLTAAFLDPPPWVARSAANQQQQQPLLVATPTGKHTAEPTGPFLEEAGTTIRAYTDAFADVVAVSSIAKDLAKSLCHVTYVVAARALIPVAQLWHFVYGTFVMECLLPAMDSDQSALLAFSGSTLVELLKWRRGGRLTTDETNQLKAYHDFIEMLYWGETLARSRLLDLVECQSAGRILLPFKMISAPGQEDLARPAPALSAGGHWEIVLPAATRTPAGAQVPPGAATLRIPERTILGVNSKEDAREILWLLKAAWPQLCSAIALMNQAGLYCWINAANNRWGGHHLPHLTHRQGISVDIQVGWEPSCPIPVVKRQGGTTEENRERPVHLESHDRLATWIAVQAFMAVGAVEFLFGDKDVVTSASEHFSAVMKTELLKSMKDKAFDGGLFTVRIHDPKVHWNHFHFEIARRSQTRISTHGGLVWNTATQSPLQTLYDEAIQRDQDIRFWKVMAGLPSPPTSAADLDKVVPPSYQSPCAKKAGRAKGTGENPQAWSRRSCIDAWTSWWTRGHDPATAAIRVPAATNVDIGLALLPLWHPPDKKQ